MYKAMKWLAIIVLMATIAGAGFVLYALNTMMPQAVQVSMMRTEAADAGEMLALIKEQVAEGSFTGRVYGDASALDDAECAFETYTVRVKNGGIFPVEWIALDVAPVAGESGEDILQLGDTGAYALHAGAEGDITATILTTIPEGEAARTLNVSGYVFGQRFDLPVAP